MKSMTNRAEVDFYKRLIAEFMLQAARVRHLGAYVEHEGGSIVFVTGDAEMKIKEFEMEAQRVSRKLLVVMSLPRENEPVDYNVARKKETTENKPWKCCACGKVQGFTAVCTNTQCMSEDLFPLCPICKTGVLDDELVGCSDDECAYNKDRQVDGGEQSSR